MYLSVANISQNLTAVDALKLNCELCWTAEMWGFGGYIAYYNSTLSCFHLYHALQHGIWSYSPEVLRWDLRAGDTE